MAETPIENNKPSGNELPESARVPESQDSAVPHEGDTPTSGTPHLEEVDAPPELRPYYVYPEPSQRSGQQSQPRGNNTGCWIIGLLTGFVVVSLVLAGLFLPPVNLGERLFGNSYTMFGDQGNAVPGEGFILSVSPDDIGPDFGVSLHSLSTSDFLSATATKGDWIPAARASIPPYLELRSGVHTIDDTGTAPAQVMLTIDLPTDVGNPYALDLYVWDAASNKWRFAPSRHLVDGTGKQMQFARLDYVPEHFALFEASAADPIILTALEIGQHITPEIAGVVTIVSPTGMRPALPTTPQRTLVGNPSAGFDLNASYRVMPVVRNFVDPRATDADTVLAIIGNRELRDEHVQQLTAFANAGGYDGIFIDYRDLPIEQRANFSSFIRELSENLHTFNLMLGVVVSQASIALDGTWETGAYHWQALGEYADYLQIDFTINPTAYSDDGFVEEMLRWAISEVNRYKILGSLSALSIREVDGTFTPIRYNEALAPLGNVQISTGEGTVEPGDTIPPGSTFTVELDGPDALPGVDTTVRAPFINYLAEDGTADATMWLTTSETLQFRLERFSPFRVGGVAFPDLLDSGVVNSLFEVLLNYRIQLPESPSPTELALNWRIESVDEEIAEFRSNFNERIIVTVDAPDGNYAVNVEVVGGGLSSARSGAPVAVFAPTITPTPLPTNTPLPTATTTPTLVPIVPTTIPATNAPGDASPPGDSPGGPTPVPLAAVFPPGGSIAVGSFEYGGHVTGTDSDRAVNAMNQAGMTWMKVQIRYGIGMGTGDVANAIGLAHMRGFKVLLGIVGAPAELAAGGGGYIQQFASFLGEVAAHGPDAIEVWNEPNLDREWPTGQISGANYTALLRESYNAIKTSNPGVMVVSAAPAPTGAEAAYPGQVVNDDNFLRQMVNAGALQYMDCVGMHYNEGIVPPTAVSGDPRDNYYTRYLPTMLDLYWNVTGGQRPICITELGYLTPQGYGGLPAFFAWASNVTIEQQAAWLAGAAAYASQSGRVRLMIVWNVDFTHYDSNDPMAGYAMIRANGDCPACRAMAGAR